EACGMQTWTWRVRDKRVARVYPEIVSDEIGYRRTKQELEGSVNKVVGHAVMHIHPCAPSVTEPHLVEVAKPKLFAGVNLFNWCLCSSRIVYGDQNNR